MHAHRLVPMFIAVALLSAACAGGGARWSYTSDGSGHIAASAPAAASPVATAALPTPVATALAAPSAAAPTSPATGVTPGSGGAASTAGSFTVEAFDLGFRPSAVDVAAPGSYAVTLNNTGAVTHDVTFDDGTKLSAPAGQTVTGTVSVPAGGIAFHCSIPGHADAGMRGEVRVAGAAVAGSSPTGGMPGMSGMPGMTGMPGMSPVPSTGGTSASATPAAGNLAALVAGIDPDPNAAPYTLYDATAPAELPGTVHDIDLVATEGLMTVAPGYTVDAWTFGGSVPGPVIRVKVGDTVRIHLKNPATNQMDHSVDFHASQVAWNDEMTSIAPGQEKLYEFTADYAGVWMYHCGTVPALHHMINGMYGMMIVDPKEGLTPVDHEFAIVQSEWYLDGQGQIASLSKASVGNPAPDLVVFNGVYNQYKDHPLRVATNDTVRFFVLDAGPNIDSSFHVVGTIFNKVEKEGVFMDAATNGGWASQAVDLAPAQAAEIELSPKEDGLYPIVTHAFNFVGRGALGLLQAGDGDPHN